mgnify:CR=1 FL=1
MELLQHRVKLFAPALAVLVDCVHCVHLVSSTRLGMQHLAIGLAVREVTLETNRHCTLGISTDTLTMKLSLDKWAAEDDAVCPCERGLRNNGTTHISKIFEITRTQVENVIGATISWGAMCDDANGSISRIVWWDKELLALSHIEVLTSREAVT